MSPAMSALTPRDRIGNGGDLQRVEVRSVAPVVGVAHVRRTHAGLERLEQVRTGAVALLVVLGTHLDDLGLLLAELCGQVGVGRTQDRLHGVAVDLLPFRHVGEERLDHRGGILGEVPVHGPDYVVGGEVRSVMPRHSLAELEGELGGVAVGRPLLGQLAVQGHAVEHLDEVVVGGAAAGVVDAGGEDDGVHLVVGAVQVGRGSGQAALLRCHRERVGRGEEASGGGGREPQGAHRREELPAVDASVAVHLLKFLDVLHSWFLRAGRFGSLWCCGHVVRFITSNPVPPWVLEFLRIHRAFEGGDYGVSRRASGIPQCSRRVGPRPGIRPRSRGASASMLEQ